MELEAARSFGYRLFEWDAECFENRVRAIGHYLHRMHREGYEAEMAEKAGKNKGARHDRANPDSPASEVFRHREGIWAERLRRREERQG